jgi:hypothetical protein
MCSSVRKRGQDKTVSKSPKNPEVKVLALKVPLTAISSTPLYSWDNNSKSSTKYLLKMGQEHCILFDLGSIKCS